MDVKKEFEEYELDLYNSIYHEDFFDGEENAMEEIIGKVTRQLYLSNNKFYIVNGEEYAISSLFVSTGEVLARESITG